MIDIKICFIAVCCASALAAPALHAAQSADLAANYPNKSIRLIVTFVPGGGSDATARAIGMKLSEKWGQQVVVDNRAGAGGAIGVDHTTKANADGYTICLISASNSVNSATNPSLPYDLEKDLQGITQATSLFHVVYIHPSVPAKTIKELIAHAKANPGKLNFGTSGTGTLQHFSGELFNHQAGIKIVHVPYKGTAGVIPAMLAGEVQMGFGSLIATRPQIQANRVRALAITAKQRSPAVDLPTVAESGLPNFEIDQWYGIIAPAKVPKSIIAKLNAAIVEALKQPDVVHRLGSDGSTPVGSSPEQFTAHIRSEIAKWKRLMKEANLQLHQ